MKNDLPLQSIVFPLGLSQRRIYAGPFFNYPGGMFSVKLAPEVPKEANYTIPVRDFGVPEHPEPVYTALDLVLRRLPRDEPVYVGCMGGIGRTGLFLSLLAKTLGIDDPIGYVRANYLAQAVETRAQEDYVAGFDVAPLRAKALQARLFSGAYDVRRWFTVLWQTR